MQRRTFIRGGLTRKGSAGLVRRAIGLAPEPRAAAPQAVAALPTKPHWGKDADGPYLVVTNSRPGETVGAVLERLHIKVKVAKAQREYDYVVQVSRSERKKVRSKYWQTVNGKYEPPPGIPCLTLELGEYDAATQTWTTTASPIQWAILKLEMPAGFAFRIRQSPFDKELMSDANLTINRRKFVRFMVEAQLEAQELFRA